MEYYTDGLSLVDASNKTNCQGAMASSKVTIAYIFPTSILQFGSNHTPWCHHLPTLNYTPCFYNTPSRHHNLGNMGQNHLRNQDCKEMHIQLWTYLCLGEITRNTAQMWNCRTVMNSLNVEWNSILTSRSKRYEPQVNQDLGQLL